MNGIYPHAAHIIGRDHILSQKNYQDSHALIETDSHIVGVLCDGCGEGARSEVGAALAAEFVASRASDLLQAGICPKRLPAVLYPALVSFLQALVGLIAPANSHQFSLDHLLFTVIGVVMTPDAGVIFAAGDGLVAIDDMVIRRDENNTPRYVGYHLFTPVSLAGSPPMPCEFDVYNLDAGWTRLAIASDGFDPELLPDVWETKHPRGLQRKFNVWSDQDHHFRDDATLMVIERG